MPFPSPGDLPNPGIEPQSPARAGGFFTSESLGKPNSAVMNMLYTHTHTHTHTQKWAQSSQARVPQLASVTTIYPGASSTSAACKLPHSYPSTDFVYSKSGGDL